jgi:long-chain acyl-CoA synthetase
MSATSVVPTANTASGGARTLWELIANAVERYGDAPALGLRDANPALRWSFRELGRQIERVAGNLAAQGVEPGDRVMLWGSNRPQWVATFAALLRLGAVVVPFDLRSASDFIQKVVVQTRPKALVADRALAVSLKAEVGPRLLLDDLFTAGPAAPPPHRGKLDDLVEIVFTSGTTGEPKGVIVSNRNLLANAAAVELALEIHPYYCLVSLLPLSHLFEQIAMIAVLNAGASTVYLHSLRPTSILEAIKDERATCMVAVPQVLELFLSGIEREVRRAGKQKQWELLHQVAHRLPFGLRKYLFKPLHQKFGGRFEFFAAGGAALDPELGQRWENMGIKVLQGYGLSEATPVVAVTRLADRAMGTVGWAVKAMEIRLADDGEILIRGPQVTPGYWENPTATAEAFENGWYHTGDLGEIDHRGRLTIKGRKKNMIALANGLNVYPEDVETALRAHPAVKDAVVMGLKRGRADIDVHAILVMHDPAKLDEAVKTANQRLAPHQQIRGSTLWPDEDFPRTLTMKARRPAISARLKAMGVGETA